MLGDPDFLLIDHFFNRLSTFNEENLCCGSGTLWNFSAHALSNSAIILAAKAHL